MSLNARLLAAVIALAACLCSVSAPAGAAPAGAPDPDACRYRAPYQAESQQDLNRNGYPDLVVGVPTAAAGGLDDAGAVDVHFDVYPPTVTGRAAQRVDESFFDDQTRTAGDRFGAATTISHIDSDCHEDVVIGAPGHGSGRGSVLVAFGSDTGLDRTGAIRIDGRTAGEHFGATVVAYDEDVFIGAPDRTVAGHARAGAVDHYRITGGRAVLVETLVQGAGQIGGVPETDDRFGSVLAPGGSFWVVIGVPGEDVGTKKDAGIVTAAMIADIDHPVGKVVRSSSFNQDSAGVNGSTEAGDRFGSALSAYAKVLIPGEGIELAVGVPGEDLGRASDAGMVQLFELRNGRRRFDGSIRQDSPTISGNEESGDRFGTSVLLGGFVLPSHNRVQHLQVVIGAPGEDLGSVVDAGAVVLVDIVTRSGRSPALRQVGPTIRRGGGTVGYRMSGTPHRGDRVGAALSAVGLPYLDGPGYRQSGNDLLAILSPGWDVSGTTDAGLATLFGIGTSTTGTRHLTMRNVGDSGGPVAGERYGVAAQNQAGLLA